MSAFWRATVIGLSVAVSIAGCGPAKPPQPPVMVANAIRVSPHTTPTTLDLVGVVQPYLQSDLHSRVTGLVTKRFFQGGQAVKADQLLYTIDPTQYEEAVANARADLAQAQAASAQAQGDVKRYGTLHKLDAIADQTYQQSISVAAQDAAIVAARRSALELAQLNLSYARIVSPMDGQIDMPSVDVGSMVTAGQTLLGTVSTLDPAYVEFSIPEGAAISYALQHNMAEAQSTPLTLPPVTMILPNGQTYPLKGKTEFAARAFASTGTISIRAIFQNPSGILRPGLNVRVRLLVGELPSALLIPQRAIGDLLGRKYVFVVGAGHIVEQRMVALGPTVGDLQVVTSGLKTGETVVADGLQFVKPGQPTQVKIIPLESATTGG